jgi:type I restriction enzyme R subunit
MGFNEDSRVKIPAILHLTRLGYTYLSLEDCEWDESSNIIPKIFRESLGALNPQVSPQDIDQVFKEVLLLLNNEDLGKQFYERLVSVSGIRLIDFENFDNNSFHVVTEFTCKHEEDEFRPDITILVNGLPLVFIEVKKPNNRDGILAERKRIFSRFQNSSFRRFINVTQFMIFSNNMEYDNSSPEPLQGAFYASTSYGKPIFNYFREEFSLDLDELLAPTDCQLEDFVLSDNNLSAIKHTPEFATNKNPNSPTNRLCTSLLSRRRLAFMLRYSIAYVRTKDGWEHHVMRYPQVFATKAIEQKIDEGVRKGIIWHTQGSGKTALAFYNVKHLTDYFHKQNVVPKFYFIVDRIDLFEQASKEFKSRGLVVHHISSRDDFAEDIKSNIAIHNDSGKPEITVVNIQRFKNDPDVIQATDYAIDLQRVYFLDEVHRSYNPKGSFLANLRQSDPNAIKIGLTGTPLLGTAYNSKSLFGDYIHKYYYNASIADGYTLRLLREEIETQYKMELKEVLEKIQVLQNQKNRTALYSHPKFVEPMLDYVIKNFEETRIAKNDHSIGAMVICDSSEQAREMYRIFEEKYVNQSMEHSVKSGCLILHDVGTKKERKDWVEDFKSGTYDILFVFNMLLTGFDAPRLKKLYMGRIVKAHNLLQALTRVNRPYASFRYGSVVDFVDIESEFKKTNQNYFDELQSELGDELENYSDLFKTEEEIASDIEAIKDALLYYDLDNRETFSQQISQIEDRSEMRKIVKVLGESRDLYNLIRGFGKYDLLDKLDFKKLNQLFIEANNHMALLNQREALEHQDDTLNILNIALEDVIFAFRKISEEELKVADELRDQLRRTREGLASNFDHDDPKFVSLKAELERLFAKKNFAKISQSEMEENIKLLKGIQSKAKKLEHRNQLLRAKYANDAKYARIHKRLMEKGDPTVKESKLIEALSGFKEEADRQVLQNAQILNNKAYAQRIMDQLVLQQFEDEHQVSLTPENTKFIRSLVLKEYLDEYQGLVAA